MNKKQIVDKQLMDETISDNPTPFISSLLLYACTCEKFFTQPSIFYMLYITQPFYSLFFMGFGQIRVLLPKTPLITLRCHFFSQWRVLRSEMTVGVPLST